jgi:hypothetical protein
LTSFHPNDELIEEYNKLENDVKNSYTLKIQKLSLKELCLNYKDIFKYSITTVYDTDSTKFDEKTNTCNVKVIKSKDWE